MTTTTAQLPMLPAILNAFLRPARFLALAAFATTLAACPRGDVGAPCNHGQVEPPESKLVTFPALSCNELLCVYADIAEPPDDACTVGQDTECNAANPGADRFECVASGESGRCRLKIEYVLERSMCSKRCSSDADCKDGGPTQKVVVEGTKCESGFSCAKIQTLGQFCCESLCVCNDDLADQDAEELAMDCQLGNVDGCCTGQGITEPAPGCG
ncbi:MAG: hypothetical protein IAG13_00130 [Deltaproteobacteria bacterium]|nr:hypothetical protein [Nannocystaceae bacterium]